MRYCAPDTIEELSKKSRRIFCNVLVDDVKLSGRLVKLKHHQSGNSEGIICVGSICASYIEVDYVGPEDDFIGKAINIRYYLEPRTDTIIVWYGPFKIIKAEKKGGVTSLLAYDIMGLIGNTCELDRTKTNWGLYTVESYTNAGDRIYIDFGNIESDLFRTVYAMWWKITYEIKGYLDYWKCMSQLFGAFLVQRDESNSWDFGFPTYVWRWYKEPTGGYVIPSDRVYEFNKNGNPYSIDKIECIVEKEVNGVVIKEKLKSGLGTTGITFSNNFMTQGLLDELYKSVCGITYQPATVKIFGDLRLELGDIVTVVDTDGKKYKIPIMSIETEYDGGVTTTFASFGGADEMSNSSGPTAQAIEKVYVKMYEADRVVADKVTAAEGEIKKLSGEFLDFKEGEFEALKSDTAEFKNTTTESLKAVNANIWSLTGEFAEFKELTTTDLTATNANISKLSGDFLTFKSGEFETLKSDTANFKKTTTESLTAINADITNLSGDFANFKTGEFENLKADQAEFEKATVKKFTAVTAQIETVTGDFLTFKSGEFETLKAKQASFEEATAQKFAAANGNIDNLTGQFATFKELTTTNFTAVTGNIKDLTVESQRVKTLLAGNITADNIATGAITAGSGIIAQGAIGDAEISNLSANKIKSGTVDTSLVTIASKDSAITITGNQMMINDTTNAANPINRVILGKYTNGSATTYGLLIRGKDGKTVMLDGDGVHNAGITNGAVDNNKVADDANISGNKLDINSVVRSVNGATEKIQSTVVQVGDRSLNVYLGEQTNTIANNYTALQGYANTKAADALKDAKSYADGVVDGVSIGGRNILLDSGRVITTTTAYNVVIYRASSLKPNTKYTFVINGFTNSGNSLGVWFNHGNSNGKMFSATTTAKTQHIVVTTPSTLYTEQVFIFNCPQATATSATINWACMYEGEIKPPLDWTPAPEDAQAQFKAVTTSLTNQSQKLLEQAGIINSQGQLIEGHTATIQTQSETLKSHETSIKANQDSIKLKVDTQTYTSDKTVINTSISDTLKDAKSYADTKKTEAISAAATDAKTKADKALADSKTFTNAEITKVNTSLSKATADITILQGQITSKVEQTDINKSVETVKLYVDGEVGKAIEDTAESIKTAKSEIKQTTDAITQNVSNLQSTVSTHTTQIVNKAETSAVTAISNRTASLETKLTGITGKVTDYVSTTVTDSTKDLVTGLETVNGSIETINSKQAGFELTLDGFATDVSNLEKTVEKKADGSALSTLSSTVSSLSSNLDGFKTSVSGTYATKTELSNTLGSYSTTKQMNSAIEASKTAITSSVSETYSTKAELTSATGKITALETWKQEASQKITKDGIVATVGSYYAKDTDLTAAENRITAAESTISQHAKEIALKVTENGVSSLIQQWYNGITIQAQKLNLIGLVTANNNFKILADGSIEAINGKFKGKIDGSEIVGGSITNSSSMYGDLTIANGGVIESGSISINGTRYATEARIVQGRLEATTAKDNYKTTVNGDSIYIIKGSETVFYAGENGLQIHGNATVFGDIIEDYMPLRNKYAPKQEFDQLKNDFGISTAMCIKGGNISFSTVSVCKSGKWVSLNGRIQTNNNYNFAAWNPQTVLTVPIGFRPYTNVYFITNINGTTFNVTIDTAGIVNLQNVSDTDIKTGTSTYIIVSASYIIA